MINRKPKAVVSKVQKVKSVVILGNATQLTLGYGNCGSEGAGIGYPRRSR